MVGETLLNRYKIESELGKGGMGIVYEAHDTLLNRVVAIKFLNTEGVGTEGKARLLQEARAAAQLNHPNIVSIYDAGETEGNPFIVMELVRGDTLRKANKPAFANAILMAQQICLALDHAHTHGIIHRDLKLENIVITHTQTLKLMDFGLARTANDAHLTQDGALMGTLAYIAPELIQGQPASAQSDLYAFGIILYELLVGHEPFQGNIGAVLGQHLHGEVTPPSKFSDAIPDWVDELILHLLSKSPEERPASAREVLNILEQKIMPPITAAYRTAPKMNNLPAQLTSFVGRKKELTDIKKLLLDAHMLTLIGPGGTGKTRLSIQAAHESPDQYPDGVWLVELAPILDPLLVPRTTAIAMGLREEPQRPVIDMLCDYLREKKILILLDNCEHLVDACAQMANKILQAAPHVRILASSREALGIAGEVTYRVPSLGLPDINHLPSVESLSQYEAIKLFIDRAISAVPSFIMTNDNALALAQICHRLDGIPLAIELAAAKIRVLNVEQIAKRLDDRFRLLTGGSRTALERHQTLRAAIDWSYNLVPPSEQALFKKLSIFIGGWTLEAAEDVCGDESTYRLVGGNDVLNVLEQLINKSLVIKDETQSQSRYHMLETMRQYANEKLVESGGSDALRDRHLEYFLNLAKTAEPHLIRPEQLEWLSQLDANYENLRSALKWALSKETGIASLRLCATLGKFWQMHSYLAEGVKWTKNSLSKPLDLSNMNERRDRIRALYCYAQLAEEIDDIQACKISAEECLALCDSEINPLDVSIAKFIMGLAYFRHSDYKNARSYFEESLIKFHELHDLYWETTAQRWFSATLLHTGEKGYGKWIENDLIKARASGERLSLAEALYYQIHRAWLYDQFDEAKTYIEEAESLYNQLSYRSNDLALFSGLIEQINGNHQLAKNIFNSIIAQQELTGSIHIKSTAIQYLGVIARDEQNLEQAHIHFLEALNIAKEFGFISIAGVRCALLGQINHLQGSSKVAIKNFQESIAIAKTIDNRYLKTNSLFIFSNTYVNIYPDYIVQIISTLQNYFENKLHEPIDPLTRREMNITIRYARRLLGEASFETSYKDGLKMSLDEALDFASKALEEM